MKVTIRILAMFAIGAAIGLLVLHAHDLAIAARSSGAIADPSTLAFGLALAVVIFMAGAIAGMGIGGLMGGALGFVLGRVPNQSPHAPELGPSSGPVG